MTHTGTQTYIVGEGDVAVIDPGPEHPDHQEAVMAALEPGERVAAILVTHSHRDHSAGAPALAERTAAPVLAFGRHGAGMSATMAGLAEAGAVGGGEGADARFAPDRRLEDGEALEIGGRRLTALHTPGHISNHLCFAFDEGGEGGGVLFTGDTVMGWSTTLVSPPDGDMGALMATLAKLAARDDRLYLPGHGPEVAEPRLLVEAQIAHRRGRARQVLAALEAGPATPAALTARVYTDVDPKLLPAATRNLLATLIWLAETEAVATDDPPGPKAVFRRCG